MLNCNPSGSTPSSQDCWMGRESTGCTLFKSSVRAREKESATSVRGNQHGTTRNNRDLAASMTAQVMTSAKRRHRLANATAMAPPPPGQICNAPLVEPAFCAIAPPDLDSAGSSQHRTADPAAAIDNAAPKLAARSRHSLNALSMLLRGGRSSTLASSRRSRRRAMRGG